MNNISTLSKLGIVNRRNQGSGGEAGWWEVDGKTCIAAYQAIGAASYAASLVNLANPGTYDAYAGSAPAWAAETGWTVTSDYLKTDIYPDSDGTWTMLMRCTGAVADNCNVGVYDGSVNFCVYGNRTPTNFAVANGGYQVVTGEGFAAGVGGFAGLDIYIDGVDTTVDIPADDNGVSSKMLYIGARNNNGSADRYASGAIQAVVIYSATLTAGEVATVSAAMAALE